MTKAIRKHLGDFLALIVLVRDRDRRERATSSPTRRRGRRIPFIEPKAFKLDGRVLRRPGGHAGPGPVGPRRGRAGGQDHARSTLRERRGGRDDGDRAGVLEQARRHVGRHGAAAPAHRPEGHVRRARPGRKRRAGSSDGGQIPVENTAPDVDPDEFLAALDTDTRAVPPAADHRRGQGPQGPRRRPERDLQGARADAPRPQPRHRRDRRAARGPEGADPPTTATSPTRWPTRTARSAARRRRPTPSSARSPSQDENISLAVSRLPGHAAPDRDDARQGERRSRACSTDAPVAARRRSASSTRPTARSCRSSARREPIVRTKIRPFVRDARPYVRDLRPAAVNLAKATPDFTKTSSSSSTASSTWPRTTRAARSSWQRRPTSARATRATCSGLALGRDRTPTACSRRATPGTFRRALARARLPTIRQQWSPTPRPGR